MGCKGKVNISYYLELIPGLQENLSFLEKPNATFQKYDSSIPVQFVIGLIDLI